jgi:hypothetical protein
MSPDGRYLALTTTRTAFTLPALRLITAQRQTPTVRELYVVDLSARTIERATRAHGGGEIDSDVFNDTTISTGGGRVAFVSLAANLFFGDANQRADAFSITRQAEPRPSRPRPPAPIGPGDIGDIDEGGDGDEPEISVGARSLSNGTVRLRVRVPAPGTVATAARARVGVTGRRRGRTRTVAHKTVFSPRAARLTIVLKPVRRYRRELRRRRRVLARVSVSFSPSRGGSRLRRSLRVAFKTKKPRRRRKR